MRRVGERERARSAGRARDGSGAEGREPTPYAPLANVIGRTRFVVLLAVAAVLLVAVALFVLGAALAVQRTWSSLGAALSGDIGEAELTVRFLEVVSVMLKAVVFYIIGVGLYALFIAPLNLPTALGVETLNDLEEKIVSVVIVLMAVTFLEHFIQWTQPVETLLFGLTLGVVVGVLVLFQLQTHRVKEDQRHSDPDVQRRAQHALFHEAQEQREVQPDEIHAARDDHRTAPRRTDPPPD